jgi:hypothetical protein
MHLRTIERQNPLKKLSRSFFRGLFVALIYLAPLHAQTVTDAPVGNSASVAAQAPEEMTKKNYQPCGRG